MKHVVLIALAVLMLAASGCDKSTDPVEVVPFPPGDKLLGLTGDHTLHYIVYDSTVVYYPAYSVNVDTTDMMVDITHGQGNQYRLSIDGAAHDLLTVDTRGVLHSGQIRSYIIPQDTVFYVPTPVLMPAPMSSVTPWTVATPEVMTASGEERRSLLFLNYGFFTQRTFEAIADVILPTSSYTAYRFQALLFYDENTVDDTLMIIDEYYAVDVGLVKLEAHSDNSHRLIILLDDN